MRAMDDLDRLLLVSLPTSTPGVTTPELHRVLAAAGHELTPRAVQKRLAGLEQRHDLHCAREGKPFRWHVDPATKRELLAPMLPHEALTLALADEHLSLLLPPRSLRYVRERLGESERALEREHGQRSRRWRVKVRKVPSALGRVPPRVDQAVFATVSEALDEELVLDVDYAKRWSDEYTRRRLHPLGLLERNDALWLVARDEDDRGELGDVKQFVVHRMRRARVARGVRVRPPANFSLERWIESGEPHFKLGPDVALVARFRADVADRLEESPLTNEQALEPTRDGWVRLRAVLPHTRALETFLMGYGSLCVVEAPPALRTAIATELQAASDAYSA